MSNSVFSVVGNDVANRLKELNPSVSSSVVEILAQEKHKERVEAFKKSLSLPY